MWKAFREMQQMGWIGDNATPVCDTGRELSTRCANLKGLQPNAKNYIGKPSLANGLAVPNPFAEDMMLKALRESKRPASCCKR